MALLAFLCFCENSELDELIVIWVKWALTCVAFMGEMEHGREQFWMGKLAGAAL